MNRKQIDQFLSQKNGFLQHCNKHEFCGIIDDMIVIAALHKDRTDITTLEKSVAADALLKTTIASFNGDVPNYRDFTEVWVKPYGFGEHFSSMQDVLDTAIDDYFTIN